MGDGMDAANTLVDLVVVFTTPDGQRHTVNVPHFPIIKSMALEIDGMPIVVVPFYMHGKTLHTVCRENTDVIDTVEW